MSYDPQPNPDQPSPPATAGAIEPDADARLWGMLCHLSSLSAYFTGVGGIVGPLVCWIIKKDQYPFVDANGKESLNFQISMLIYYAVAGLLSCFLIGIPLLIALMVANVVLVIIASVKA